MDSSISITFEAKSVDLAKPYEGEEEEEESSGRAQKVDDVIHFLLA